MAFTTYTDNGGGAPDGSDLAFTYTFPVIKTDGTDVRVSLDGVTQATNKYTVNVNTSTLTFHNTNGVDSTYQAASGAPLSGVTVRVYRDTTLEDADTATFVAGSAIRAQDLNANFKQTRYALQEEQQIPLSSEDITDGSVTTAKIADNALDSDHYKDGSIDLIHLSASSVNSSKIVDDSIVNADINSSAAIAHSKLANVTSGQLLVGNGSNVPTAVAVSGDVTMSNAGAVTIASAAVEHSMLADDAVDGDILAADAVTGAHIADNAIDSEHYTDGSIDNAHLADDAVGADELAANAVVNASVASGAAIEFTKLENLDSAKILVGNGSNKATEVSVSGDVTIANTGAVTIASDAVEQAMIADDAVGADQLAANAVVNASVASGAAIAHSKLAAIPDTQIIVGNGSTVPTAVAMSGDATIANTGAVTIAANAVEIGMIGCEQTTITDSDSHVPTSGAVVDYVAAQLAPIGGLEVIADDESFPNTIPATGVVISISDAAGLSINSSGVSTNADTLDNSTVTINGFPSELRGGVSGNADPYVLAAGTGLMVQSTGSSQTYNYHQVMIREADFVQLSDDINDFNSRYRIGTKTADNASSNDDGDLFFDTGTNKMYVYDGAYDSGGAWTEVTSAGDYKYLTIKDHDQAVGGSGPTFNDSNEEFDLFDGSSDASINTAAQLIVVLNGVIQKPNTGTFSGSEEGYYLNDTHGIKFCDPPATGSTLFVTQIGTATTLSVPADDSVTAAKIGAGAVIAAKIGTGAVEHAKLGADCVDGDNIQDDVINSEHIVAGAIDLEHMSSESVDEDNLHISNAGSNGQYLQKSAGSPGLTWATPDSGSITWTLGINGGADAFTFTGDGFASATDDPTLYVTRGQTYKFVNGNSAGTHAFNIESYDGDGTYTSYTTGMTTAGATGGNTMTWIVPMNAPRNLRYVSGTTAGMTGNIVVDESEGESGFRCTTGSTTKGLLITNGVGSDTRMAQFGLIDGGTAPAIYGSGSNILSIANVTSTDFDTGNVTLGSYGTNDTTAATLKLEGGGTSNTYGPTISGPATAQATSNYTITLPGVVPTANGQALTATTAGVCTWDGLEGTIIKSTTNSNEADTKYLRADGDGTCSWQTVSGGVSSDGSGNTYGGSDAGNADNNSGATNNTAFGHDALVALTSGDYNTGIGDLALAGLTTEGANTAVGYKAGHANDGDENTYLGKAAGEDTTGDCNVFLGSQAGAQYTSAFGGVGIGFKAFGGVSASACTGATSVFIGHQAGEVLTSGAKNTVVGYEAGHKLTTSSGNCFFGKNAGKEAAASFENNIMIGYHCGQKLTDGTGNVFIGANVADGTTDADIHDYNVGIGYAALYDIGHGTGNTAVGQSSGADITTGDNVTCIGKDAGLGNAPSGAVTTGSNIVCLGNNSVTDIYCADTSIASSDSRDKTDIANFSYGLDWINKLRPVTYRWDKRTWYDTTTIDDDGKRTYTVGTPDGSLKRPKKHVGFLAQEVLAVEQADGFAGSKNDMLVVNLNEDETAYGLKYERLVPVLVNAIKELSTEVNTLKTKVAALEAG